MTVKQALEALKDETVEFFREPSKDEASDIAYCINRLGGALIKRPYLNIVGGTKTHIDKIEQRMKEYGCIRSSRHLINGKCPSE